MDKPFIAPKPVDPANPATLTARQAAAPAVESGRETERKRGFSLFGRVTGAGIAARRPDSLGAPQADQRRSPAAAEAPAKAEPQTEPNKPALEEEDLLEIPAFLRRQAN